MKRLLTGIAIAALLLTSSGFTPEEASAATPQAYVYGNANLSGGATGFPYGHNDANLNDNVYGIWATACPRGIIYPSPPAYYWNDCISSLQITNSTCNYGFVLFHNANYVGPYYIFWGNGTWNMWTSMNDTVSSVKWVYRTSCSGPGPLSPPSG